MNQQPFNHRRTLAYSWRKTAPYKALKAFLWLFWKPYSVSRGSSSCHWDRGWCSGTVVYHGHAIYCKDRSYNEVHDKCEYSNAKKAHAWAFRNLSISGKLIQD